MCISESLLPLPVSPFHVLGNAPCLLLPALSDVEGLTLYYILYLFFSPIPYNV